MNCTSLEKSIRRKGTFLCIGLDPDMVKIKNYLEGEEDMIFRFNKKIIDATHDLCVAYKPNTAFYEACGSQGWVALEKTVHYIRERYPDIFIIADAKRGDIGNTARMYAKAFYETLGADAVTVAPYMGRDSVEPFLMHKDKMAVLLALTSNPGAEDFEMLYTSGSRVYEEVLKMSKTWKNRERLMYVVGATRPEYLSNIRRIIPQSFLLIPGVGTQGGKLEEVCRYGMNDRVGILVNISRNILYAGHGQYFDKHARQRAQQWVEQMRVFL